MIDKSKLFNSNILGDITIIIIAIISSLILMYLCIFQIDNNRKIINFNENFVETKYAKIVDLYDTKLNESFSDFMRKEDSSDKLKSFNKELLTNNQFNYLELNDQPIETFGYYDGPLFFVNGYERGNSELANQIDGNKMYFTPISAFQIGKKAADYFSLHTAISNGKFFHDKDYEYDGKEEISVVLGYDYSSIYKIGDSFETTYLFCPIKCNVIGFIEKNTTIPYNGRMLTLDKYVIMPFFDIVNEKIDFAYEFFSIVHYSLKTSGFIPYKNVEQGILAKKLIENIGDKYELKYTTTVIGGENNYNEALNSSLYLNNRFLIVSILFMFFIIVSTLVIQRNKLRRNMKLYSIYLFNGMSISKLKKILFFHLFINLLLAWLISCFVFYLLNFRLYNYSSIIFIMKWVFILHIVIVVFSCFLFNCYMNSINIYMAIRRE